MSAPRPVPYDAAKRLLDVVGASLALLATLPIQLVVALLVAAKLGRPVLFRQDRPGRGSAVFTMRKFRSMLPVDESRGWVTDEQRLTRFGSILRSTSLDELPTLVNVLLGDMSMVGPRPLLVSYLSRYTPAQARRHEVRPGVTGLAQIRGRNSLDWDSKLALDVEYVDRRSAALDLRILLETISIVVRRDGISSAGSATMDEFEGTDQGGSA